MVEGERKRGGGAMKFALFIMIMLVAAASVAVYHFGADGSIMINGRGVDQLAWWEVVGGVLIGLVGLVIGLAGGAIGLVVGLLAAFLAIALSLLGIFAGLFITAGVVLGPFLLIAAIIILMRRRTHPDVV
ncbi:MAG: hypothetical protein V2I43_14895 [Parvularcula sp.]|jgi:hypothetical protein|nr:hypothetical protein [Parvularcula sp.]